MGGIDVITFEITKKRGNWRPKLVLKVNIPKELNDLGLPWSIPIRTTFPKVCYTKDGACREGQYERGDPPEFSCDSEEVYISLKGSALELVLPWRPGSDPQYPEVEEFILRVRTAVERQILMALESHAMDLKREVDWSHDFKRTVAPYLASVKMTGKA
jgi:hypothetical protein